MTSRLFELRAAETSNGIIGVGLAIVAIELVSGLVEGPGTKSYAECLSGLTAMAHHVHHDQTNQPIIIPHPYLHIARSFFIEVPPQIELQIKQVGGVVFDFKKDVTAAHEWHTRQNTFDIVKTWLQAGEQEFPLLMENLIKGAEVEVAKKHPQSSSKHLRKKTAEYLLSDDFKVIVAMAIIIAAAITLNKEIPPGEEVMAIKSFPQNDVFNNSCKLSKWGGLSTPVSKR